jgi:capsular exopolysaccharide synthesis family protein
MSRIEEALRRTNARHESRSISGGRDVTPADDRTLTQYPEEVRAPGARPAGHEATARVIAAPRLGPPRLAFESALEDKLVVEKADPFAVEQYRRLAAAMHELQVDRGLKTLMVTSALPREGKTLTVTNLALTLSESYKRRVLLVDADLRRPTVHEIFRLPNARGLSEGLRPNAGELSVLQVSERLSVLPAGHPDSNPMAGLTSDRMRAVLEEAAASYDWVLLDSPPVGLMPDASLLARLTGAVIFVIAAGSTPYQAVDRALDDLGRSCVIGTVLNRAALRDLPSAGQYGHYYGSKSPAD